ncbi:MAG: HTTM domain-containing protein [Nannocystaceae bacterium]|nr:HTTM domain-containing protein [Nannocystaceae bacterium]
MAAPITQHVRAITLGIADRLHSFGNEETHVHGQRVFVIGIYSWILVNTLLLLPYYDAIWGPESLVSRASFDPSGWHHWLVKLSLHPTLADHTYVFILGQLISLGLVFSRAAPKLGAVGVYLFTFNLYNRTGQVLDGGNNLVQLLTFYFLFMNISGRFSRGRGWLRQVSVAASNAALWMCRIQVAIVYLSAGILKLNGALWQKGMALYYVLQGDSYTHPLAREAVVEMPELAMLATYGAVIFQILFVVLVWNKRARPYLVAAGIGLHLIGIAFGMGLFLFGTVMCLAYLAFIDEGKARRLRHPFTSSTCLEVLCPPTAPLAPVLRGIAKLDWFRRLDVIIDLHATEVEGFDPATGRRWRGITVSWPILLRVPVLLPLVPCALVGWYVGLAQRLFGRWFVPPS